MRLTHVSMYVCTPQGDNHLMVYIFRGLEIPYILLPGIKFVQAGQLTILVMICLHYSSFYKY